MKPKTKVQIAKELKALEKIKPLILRSSAFGDDHQAAIDAQINVLKKEMSIDKVYDEYPYNEEQENEDSFSVPFNVFDSASEAARWLIGEEEEGLAAGWESLKEKR